MSKKTTLRADVIMTSGMIVGSAAGALVEFAAVYLGPYQPGIGELITAAVALWMPSRLNKLAEKDDGDD